MIYLNYVRYMNCYDIDFIYKIVAFKDFYTHEISEVESNLFS